MPEHGVSPHVQKITSELRERDLSQRLNIIVIGPAGSGKTTLLQEFGNYIPVFTEPQNPAFDVMLQGLGKGRGEHLHYTSQLSKMSQMLTAEAQSTLSDEPVVALESSVLATTVYNRLFHDQGLMTDDQFAVLDAIYKDYLQRLSHSSTLVVYLEAQRDKLKDRTFRRDGIVANDYRAQDPYWEQLQQEIQEMGVALLRIDTTLDPSTRGMTENIMDSVQQLAA